jgi:hypothetical protein
VIGICKQLASNLAKFPIEIVSAEIKIDPQAPVVAFGQAIAYLLFSTKTYIGMPTTLTEEDQSRLESLCMLFGIGLVLFHLDKDVPRFSIRVRALRFCSTEGMVYRSEDDGLQWRKLAVQWHSKATAEHATGIAIVEEG